MDPLEWILAFVDEISAPARAMTGNIHDLVKALKELQGIADKLKPITLPSVGKSGSGGGVSKQANEMQKFANMWQRIGMKMLADENKRAREFADIWAKIGAKMAADQAKEAAKAQRAAERTAKLAARGAERASHKSYFGGHKSISGLLGARVEHKVSGMATGAADTLLGAPGALIGGASSAFGAVASGAAEIAFNLGKAAIDAQSMREDSVVAMTQLFHSSDQANALFDVARQAAKETKLDTKDMVGYFTSLARSFSATEVEKLAWTIADVESSREGKGRVFTEGLLRLKGRGPVAQWGPFAQAAAQGPAMSNVLPVLSEMIGSKKTLKGQDVQRLMRQGKISTDTALQSIVTATNRLLNTKTGQAGEFAKRTGGETWSGVISNMKNAMGDVLNMQLPDTHPIYQFKKLLQAIAAKGGILDSMSIRGQAFEKIISDLVADVFRLISLDPTDIDGAMDGLLKLGTEVQQTFSRFVDYVRKEVYPAISQAIQDLNSGNLEVVLGKLAAKIAWIVAKGIANGIGEGLEGAFESLPGISWLAANGHANSAKILAQRNQATAAADGGVELGGGFVSGKPESYGSGGIVPGPIGKPRLAIVHGGEKYMGTESAAPGWAMGGSGAAGKLEQHLHFHGNTDGEEASIKEAVKQGTLEAFMEMSESMAAAQGAQR